MSEDQHEAVRVIISGRVQGVWYRNWTIGEATARGLDGWVRNRRDGTVEALFSGSETVIRDMITACHDGPPLAKVLSVEEHPELALEPGSGFTKRGSA
jgi:acylphosphatase